MYPQLGREGVRGVNVKVSRGEGDLVYDPRIKDMRPAFLDLLRDLGVTSVQCGDTPAFNGHSFEMAVVMAAFGLGGTYSGIVDRWDAYSIHFTPAEGTVLKRSVFNDLITPVEIPGLRRFPTSV